MVREGLGLCGGGGGGGGGEMNELGVRSIRVL
jgi:hypothetical protein